MSGQLDQRDIDRLKRMEIMVSVMVDRVPPLTEEQRFAVSGFLSDPDLSPEQAEQAIQVYLTT